jgi:hypothetical protein
VVFVGSESRIKGFEVHASSKRGSVKLGKPRMGQECGMPFEALKKTEKTGMVLVDPQV